MSSLPPALTIEETAHSLAASLDLLHAVYRGTPSSALQWRPASAEWCANEVIGHFIEAEERGFAGRIRTLLASDTPNLSGWDQEEVATARDDCARDPLVLLREFARLREPAIAMVRGLKPADLSRGGTHPQIGYVSVGELLSEWVYHDQNHIRQLLANLQAYVWPNMGSTQKFYST